MRALSTLVRYKEKRSESLISQSTALVPAKHYPGNSRDLYRDNVSSKNIRLMQKNREVHDYFPSTLEVKNLFLFCLLENMEKIHDCSNSTSP
jgi:hypothetical protein